MTICILGRQPEIGLAELEALYGAEAVRPVGDTCALVDGPVDFDRLGGSVKAAKLLATLPTTERKTVFKRLARLIPGIVAGMPETGKIKLGLSLYGFTLNPYDLGGEALQLKKLVRRFDRSVRVVPNETPALSSAQTFHNSLATELGLELVLVRDGEQTLVGRVTNVQNIDAYRIRDRERPKRDTFVGMLPPKLAQVIVNLACGKPDLRPQTSDLRKPQKTAVAQPEISDLRSQICILDPFCGTGVVLQEALLMGYDVYGSDISPKMIDYSKTNLDWLRDARPNHTFGEIRLETADATDHIWRQPVSAVACEGYLGQPLGGQNPSPEKLREIIHDCNTVMREFLKNIAPQLTAGTPLCIAMPAWSVNGTLHHLPVTEELKQLGFTRSTFTHTPTPLVYRRDDQVTARELVVLTKS